jgi:hypothetical protein
VTPFRASLSKQTENRVDKAAPLTHVQIIAELRPERNLSGVFSFAGLGRRVGGQAGTLLSFGRSGADRGNANRQISRANQRMRPMILISSAVPS